MTRGLVRASQLYHIASRTPIVYPAMQADDDDVYHALVESAEYAIESYADRIQHVMGLADHVAESSPFQKWLAENGAKLEFDQEGNPKRLRIDTILSMLKGNSYESARRVAQEAIDAWRHSGNDVLHFSDVQMVWRMPGGGRDSRRVGKLATW